MEPTMKTPEEMAEIQKSRTESDAELIKDGAEYIADEKGNMRLDVTLRQRDAAAIEMVQEWKMEENVENMDTYEREKFTRTLEDMKNTVEMMKQYLERVDFYDEEGIPIKKTINFDALRQQDEIADKLGKLRGELRTAYTEIQPDINLMKAEKMRRNAK